MVTRKRLALLGALKLFDLLTMLSCLAAAAVLVVPVRGASVPAFLAMRVRVSNVLVVASMALCWHLVLVLAGVYRSARLRSAASVAGSIVGACVAGTALVYALAVAARVSLVRTHALLVPLFFVLVTAATLAGRAALYAALGVARRRGRNLRHAVVVGANRRALAFAERLLRDVESGYRLVGFVDSDAWSGGAEVAAAGHRLLGGLEELPALLRREVVDEVFVFLPFKSFYAQEALIVSQCEEQGVRVTFPSALFELRHEHVAGAVAADDELVSISTGAIDGWRAAAKRVFDVAGAAALLVLLSPLLAVVAALVKLSSPGPVLYAQERVGRAKRRFRMWKFRTMVVDADRRMAELEHLNEADGPVFKIRKDPRITPLGAFLRKTSIDELPQLWNVLRGDLSLVGPRPLPVRDYERFACDWHRRRFSVRPGITCLWQVGGRSDIPFERWMELDLEYIDTWSLWLDLKILARTIPAVLRGRGAA